MQDCPIQIGEMLLTLVEPRRGHEAAYNRWYERDHFYAGCLVGPWLFAGKRWVAPKALKQVRFPDDSPIARPTVQAGSYCAMYWIHEGRHDEHHAWANQQAHQLYKDGRGFQERTHVHTLMYTLDSTIYRDDDPVPIELALDGRRDVDAPQHRDARRRGPQGVRALEGRRQGLRGPQRQSVLCER